MSLGLLSMFAVPWAMGLTVGGLWLLVLAPGMWPKFASVFFVTGATSIAAGQLVFAFCVADRLFPSAGRRIGWWIEGISCAVLFGGVAWLCWLGVSGLFDGGGL